MFATSKHRIPIHAGGPQRSTFDQKLRHDRWVAIVVVGLLIALMALLIGLASISGTPVQPIDHWPMMP